MKKNITTYIVCYILFSNSHILADSVRATVDLKNAESIDRFTANISLSHHISVTSLGKDMADGYVIAAQLHHTGVSNTIYLEGTKKPDYKAKDLPLIKLTNFKITPRLKAQIMGYNLYMAQEHLQKKLIEQGAASDR